ncbi:phage major tail protein, TP901-1 family [Bacillus changyiensis]|uniref:phage major tail protein, TP901-1 family n=1 Tax=Bacillus changyiensis TaxID=3004103 RepID=UPI0022E0F9C7|nr:phage major tail protein, TP901-1 family [Bacillus changyiensis]MDA1478361.1 phage major tail protein, TP901-1 family [Bacillus changyiensis]
MPNTGKKIVYLVQASSAPVGSKGLLVAHQTEGTWTREQEMVDEQTKTGRIVGYGSKSETFELTFYEEDGDDGQKALEWTYDNESELKVWRVNLNQKNANGKYNARFGYTIIENLESSEPADGFVEINTSLPVLVRTVPGELELPDNFVETALNILWENPGDTTGGFNNRKKEKKTT